MKLKKNEQLKYNIYLAIKEYSKEHCMYPTSKELYTALVSLPYDTKNTPRRVKRVFDKYIEAIVIWYTIDFIKQVGCPESLHQYIDDMFVEYFFNVIYSPVKHLGHVIDDNFAQLSIPFRMLYQHWMHVHKDLYMLNKKLSVELLARKMGVEIAEKVDTDKLLLLPLIEKSLYPDSYLANCKEFTNAKRVGIKVLPSLGEVFKLEGIDYMLGAS